MYISIPMNKELLDEMIEGNYDVLNEEKKNERRKNRRIARKKIEKTKKRTKKCNRNIQRETETHIRYFLDCDVYEGLPTMSDYESFEVDFEKSVKLEGLVSDKELQKIQSLADGSTIFKIMNMQHAASYYFENGEADWEDRLDESDWFITIYLHKDETEDFIKENIRIFL